MRHIAWVLYGFPQSTDPELLVWAEHDEILEWTLGGRTALTDAITTMRRSYWLEDAVRPDRRGRPRSVYLLHTEESWVARLKGMGLFCDTCGGEGEVGPEDAREACSSCGGKGYLDSTRKTGSPAPGKPDRSPRKSGDVDPEGRLAPPGDPGTDTRESGTHQGDKGPREAGDRTSTPTDDHLAVAARLAAREDPVDLDEDEPPAQPRQIALTAQDIIRELNDRRATYGAELTGPGRARVSEATLHLGRREDVPRHADNVIAAFREMDCDLEAMALVMLHQWKLVGQGVIQPPVVSCTFHHGGGGWSRARAAWRQAQVTAQPAPPAPAPAAQDFDVVGAFDGVKFRRGGRR